MKAGLRTSLLAAIPFVLLFNSDRVEMKTRMYQDASGVRTIQTSGDVSLQRQLLQWTRDTSRGYNSDGMHVSNNRVHISRSSQVANLGALDEVDAYVLDIVRAPLSLKTTYEFSERITVDFTYGTEKERVPAPWTSLEYTLIMPGRITGVAPAKTEVLGGRCTWILSASEPDVRIHATSEAWRWDLIVVLAYVLVYVGYRVISYLTKRARLRPRKI